MINLVGWLFQKQKVNIWFIFRYLQLPEKFSYTEIPEDQKIKVFARIGISEETNEESQQ